MPIWTNNGVLGSWLHCLAIDVECFNCVSMILFDQELETATGFVAHRRQEKIRLYSRLMLLL